MEITTTRLPPCSWMPDVSAPPWRSSHLRNSRSPPGFRGKTAALPSLPCTFKRVLHIQYRLPQKLSLRYLTNNALRTVVSDRLRFRRSGRAARLCHWAGIKLWPAGSRKRATLGITSSSIRPGLLSSFHFRRTASLAQGTSRMSPRARSVTAGT